MSSAIQTFQDLPVYTATIEMQRSLFQLTKQWPKEETYSLIDQIRRSSRSVGANVAEAWAKRRYRAHFVSKLTDADAELQETRHWLRTALDCGYISVDESNKIATSLSSVGRQLGAIMARANEFCL